MTPFSMESVFLILSGVIFLAGILYWFWSHIQLTQKKVLLLESAVFELRSQLTRLPEATGPPAYKPIYTDLADDWEEDASGNTKESETVEDSNIPDELRPGGYVSTEQNTMGSFPSAAGDIRVDENQKTVEESNTQFRELFLNENTISSVNGADVSATANATSNSVASTPPESLESMSLKELRRLAEQRGIPNPNDLRKKEILSALRHQINPPANDLKVVQLNENDVVSVNEILE